MKGSRSVLRIISILLLLTVVGAVIIFFLIKFGIINNPYDKKVELISLSQNEIRLKKNKSFQLTSKVYPDNANGKVIYKSNKEDVVSVNELTGYVLAKENGQATITAYLESNKSIKAECFVIVSENNIKVEKITVNPKNINLQVGKKYQINYKYSPKEATLHEFEYISSDSSVATVDKLGMIEAKGEGQAYITVSDKISGNKDRSLVKVISKNNNNVNNNTQVDPTGIEVTPKDIKISVAGSKQISAKVKPSKANQSVTWESVDQSIATVNNKGVITGKKAGNTKVVATTINGIEALVNVVVTNDVINVTGISVKNNNITLDVGKSANISYTIIPSNATNQGVTITSSDNNIVKVDGNKITALNSGNVTVTIKTKDGGYEAKINVKVNRVNTIIDETDINLSTTNVNLKVGKTKKVNATIIPSNATYKSLDWKSNNTNIATVNNGLIEGKSAGKTEIVVTTTHKKISKKIKVTISNIEVEKISLNPTNKVMNVGEKFQLTKTIIPTDATNKNVTWTSSNTTVASVNNTGLVVANSAGTATIKITSNNGKSATCTIKVNTVSAKPIASDGTINNSYFGITTGKGVSKDVAGKNRNGINAAIEYASKNKIKNIKLEKGSYVIHVFANNPNSTNWYATRYGIRLKSNIHFDLNGSTIRMYTQEYTKKDPVNVYARYQVFSLDNVSNVTITNGTIVGDRDTHTCLDGTPIMNLGVDDQCRKSDGSIDGNQKNHQLGHGIAIDTGKNIIISKLNVKFMVGDAVYIRGKSSNITIDNNELHHCRRQGVSVLDGSDITIKNNYIHMIKGSNPGAGIDLEPGSSDQRITNIVIDSNRIYKTTKAISIGVCPKYYKNITIKNNTLGNNIRTCSTIEGQKIKNNTFENGAVLDNKSDGNHCVAWPTFCSK